MNNRKVTLNKYGFYQLSEKPTQEELKKYYKDVYYQEANGSYEKAYNEQELKFIKNKLEQKYILLNQITDINNRAKKFLDIGCGEGWTLKFFKEKGWEVCGLDYSSYGCNKFNEDISEYLVQGDLNENLDILILQNKKFDVIYMINLLEHVLEPYSLLEKVYELLSEDGALIIQVPNDFSKLQRHLIEEKIIKEEFWICNPDHISYFNSDGLKNICEALGFKPKKLLADFPIDINLLNMETNYIEDKSKGKSCHNSRVAFENFLSEVSNEKTNNLYESLAVMGLGRNIILFCSK